MGKIITVMHEGSETTLLALSNRYGLTVEALRQRWVRGERGARLVRAARTSTDTYKPPEHFVVDPQMQRLIDSWNSAVFPELVGG